MRYSDKNKDNNNKAKIQFILSGIWKYLKPKRRWQLLFLIFLMLLSGLSEVVSLASVIPFLSVLSDPDSFWKIKYLNKIASFLGFTSSDQLLLPVTIIFILAIVSAATIRLLNLWLNCRIAAAIGSDISCEAFKRTLYQPYKVHIDRNSSDVIASITTEINITVGVIDYFLQLVTSGIIIIFLIISVLIINSSLAFGAISVFGSIYLIIVFSVRKKLARNSKKISRGLQIQLQTLQEGIGAIRDILLDGNQAKYINIYEKSDRPRRRLQADNLFIAVFSRYTLEAFGLIFIATIAFFLTNFDSNTINVIPFLGTIALGAQRLLPVTQQFYGAWASIKGNIVAVIKVLEILKQPVKSEEREKFNIEIPFKKEIIIKNLSFSYHNNSSKEILKNINLTINCGEKIGFIGTTGGGKSTLFDLLMGLMEPTQGTIYVDGINLFENNEFNTIQAWRKKISHVPQNIYLADSTIAENIAFGVNNQKLDLKRVKQAAESAQIANFIESYPSKYKTFTGERGVQLSGGQKQRIGIARALYKKSEILFLDEATSALDKKTEAKVIDAISKLSAKMTLIMIAHRESTLENCDKIFKIENGIVNRYL